MSRIIDVKNLKYRYPKTDKIVLDNLTFSVEKGEFIGIIGANSAGKSTLGQALIGLVPHFYKGTYAGEVTVNGINVLSASVAEISEHVGMVFQNPFTQVTGAKTTVFDEVAFGLENLGLPRAEIFGQVETALKTLGIWEFRDKNPFELSGGQMQRMAIASVIAMNPEVLILDEPTSQLDPEGSEQVFEACERLQAQGMTIIMLGQKMDKIARFVDKMMLIDNGKIIDFNTAEVIFSRDDLEALGVDSPPVTILAKKMNKKKANGYFPVTLEELEALL
ncbi:energy-coupling factor ABC transporter ATP-binding protein [Lactococcus insecticola]|uniref:ABC transporter ATP-binding protein n=1 Tax=Pseudolactococcus insecticola TaxID=2709158 RepID=A0A6A0B6A0_9LACT|nr:ABC transporter ATP-binding protein [Lactococcus insecticola]GFH40476.1 ABC transporter ATP-binding protein [Lactococcus insecticola]